ncbi:AMP nucleosidase [Balneolaceae bacterium ANBcel3]|nr:AMP nucleosidase [Balneolaceae bacterium ANBcel3]
MPDKTPFTIKKESDNPSVLQQSILEACDLMEKMYDQGYYPKMNVVRSWSQHNPVIEGEFAKPGVYRWYLQRELTKLAESGAEINISKSRKAISLTDPAILNAIDESQWDFTKKKLFLFPAERIDLSLDRLEHYTGTSAGDFQRYIMFTNYDMHVEVFKKRFPDCIRPGRKVQMPAYHHTLADNLGLTLINIGVGPSNAKTITDHVAVLRPDAMIMVGHCGGLRNHQEIGDYVLASGYMREDGVLDSSMPKNVPIIPNHLLNYHLKSTLEKEQLPHRIGTIYTIDNRNWEFMTKKVVHEIHLSRSIAIDMESATVATNGFRYRVPSATLLCVSDKPLHGQPKLGKAAQSFYQNSKEKHLDIVMNAISLSKKNYPGGLPNSSIRAMDEPLMGGTH